MLHKPKKRIWPLLIRRICSNILRQAEGEQNGSKPSRTSMHASASQSVLLSKGLFTFWKGPRRLRSCAWP
jgi:hypothetical protein